MGQRGEDPARGAAHGLHASSHDSDQRQIGLDLYGIRLGQPVDRGNYSLLFVHEFVLMDDDRHCINAGRHVLEGDAALFEGLQDLAAKADLGIHQGLGDQDRAESLLAGDAGDDITGFLACALDDPGAVCIRLVGVADIDRNTLMSDREDRVLVKDGSAHVRELSQFSVGDRLDSDGIVDDAGIRDHETGYVGPVLIDVGPAGPGDDRSCDVAAASGESLDIAVKSSSVESGDHGPGILFQRLGEHFIGLLGVQIAVLVKKDHVLGVQELISQIARHNTAVEIFAAGSRVIAVGILVHAALDLRELAFQAEPFKTESLNDLVIALLDDIEFLSEILILGSLGMHSVKKIGDLVISAETLSGSGGNDIHAGGILPDDVSDLLELF